MDTLYEIVGQYKELLEMGEVPEEELECWNDTLEAINDELEVKADNYAKIIQEWKGQQAKLAAEVERLSARKKALDNSIDRLKSNLENAMRICEKTKFKTEYFSFNIQKNPPSVEVDDVDVNVLPAEFLTFSDPKINKTAVKAALKEGTELEWARMVQTEGLRIK